MTYSIDAIIFDFDGVLVESNHIRTEGFRRLLKSKHYPHEKIGQFILFHEANGGLSRYYKLRYFFEKILKENISNSQLFSLCNEYSTLVKQAVAEAQWVEGAAEFLRDNHLKYKFFIVSGSDQSELREICRIREIDRFVQDILGSPTDKKTNIKSLLHRYNLSPEHTLFVGDSVNDLEAAQSANVRFIARDSGSCGEWSKNLIIIRDLSHLSQYVAPITDKIPIP